MTDDRIEFDEPSQAILRDARKLLRRKERKAAGEFLVEGRQAVREALRAPGVVKWLFVQWSAARDNKDLVDLARAEGVPVYAVSEQNLGTLCDTVTPQGLVAVARNVDVALGEVLHPERERVVPDAEKKHRRRDVGLVVICAQIRDPGNAGTVIRCADAMGADAVILSSDSVDVYNPKTVRSTVGSLFHLPIVIDVEVDDAIAACREAGMQVFATDADAGTDLTDLDAELERPTAWVMGNEAWGLPLEHLTLADKTVAVPIYGHAESLNLAAAAAICLYASASAQRAHEH
ncbi:MAG: RNA methyltransferase [Propioniciclava sp.]